MNPDNETQDLPDDEKQDTPDDEKKDDVKLVLVKPKSMSDEDLWEAAEKLFGALTSEKKEDES